MRLIYCYVKKFRNIYEQELLLSPYYDVKLDGNKISIARKDCEEVDSLFENENLRNLHIIVGKTGAGKTNLLQLIGLQQKDRQKDADNSQYFFLYSDNEHYYIEIFNMELAGFELKQIYSDLPEFLKDSPEFRNKSGMFRFDVIDGKISNISNFHANSADTSVFSGYDMDSFTVCPFSGLKEEIYDSGNNLLNRNASPYQKTSVRFACDYLYNYISSFGENSIKRNASLVIKRNNWGNEYDTAIPENLMLSDYWTFAKKNREKLMHAVENGKKYKPFRVSVKQQFMHDLMTDFAIYIRTFIAKRNVERFSLDESETEYLDYYLDKNNREYIRELPDYEDLSIIKRICRLMQWLDYKSGYDKGVHWRIYDDIQNIYYILNKFDDMYFTADEFRIPIVDMFSLKNKEWIYDLFERMEGYIPDDSGLFEKELLPYHFDCISYGEYQYAKVLSGIYQYCSIIPKLNDNVKVIYLMDEPETHMHPELCRRFICELQRIIQNAPKQAEVQVIISTHSPFMLSDVSSKMVTRLDVDENGFCKISNESSKNYFAANIFTILADGFFLDYTIGEGSRKQLQEIVGFIKEYSHKSNSRKESNEYKELFERYKNKINYIGDDEIKRALYNMLEGC